MSSTQTYASTTLRDESNHHATYNTTDIHNEDSKHNTHNKDATYSERLVSEDAKISHIHDIQKTLKLSNHSRLLQLKTTKALKSDWGGGLIPFCISSLFVLFVFQKGIKVMLKILLKFIYIKELIQSFIGVSSSSLIESQKNSFIQFNDLVRFIRTLIISQSKLIIVYVFNVYKTSKFQIISKLLNPLNLASLLKCVKPVKTIEPFKSLKLTKTAKPSISVKLIKPFKLAKTYGFIVYIMLFAYSPNVYATDECNLNSDESCVSLSQTNNKIASLGSVRNPGTHYPSDSLTLTFKLMQLKQTQYKLSVGTLGQTLSRGPNELTLIANKAMIESYNLPSGYSLGSFITSMSAKPATLLSVQGGASLQTTFNESLFKASTLVFASANPNNSGSSDEDVNQISTLTFDGSYIDSTNPNAPTNHHALVLDDKYGLILQAGWNNFSFYNDANAKTNITTVKQMAVGLKGTESILGKPETTVVFNNSSLEGTISFFQRITPQDTTPQAKNATFDDKAIFSISFSGNSATKTYGTNSESIDPNTTYALKGDINGGTLEMNVSLENNARMFGSIKNYTKDQTVLDSFAITGITMKGTYSLSKAFLSGDIVFIGSSDSSKAYALANASNHDDEYSMNPSIQKVMIEGGSSSNLTNFMSANNTGITLDNNTQISDALYEGNIAVEEGVEFTLTTNNQNFSAKNVNLYHEAGKASNIQTTTTRSKSATFNFIESNVQHAQNIMEAKNASSIDINAKDSFIYLEDIIEKPTQYSDLNPNPTSPIHTNTTLTLSLNSSFIFNDLESSLVDKLIIKNLSKSQIQNISNTNVDSTINLSGVKKTGNILFHGKVTGTLFGNRVNSLTLVGPQANIDKVQPLTGETTKLHLKDGATIGSDLVQENILKFDETGATVELDISNTDFTRSIQSSSTLKMNVTSSSIKDISIDAQASTLVFNTMNDKTVGNIAFRGTTLTGNFAGLRDFGNLMVEEGNANLNFNDIQLINQPKSFISSGINQSSHATTYLAFMQTSLSGVISASFYATSKAHFQSKTLGDIVFTDKPNAALINKTGKIDKEDKLLEKDNTPSPSQIASLKEAPSQQELQHLLTYLNASGISGFAGHIYTMGEATNSVVFDDSLYLGGVISTLGGTSNVSINLSDAFISKIATDSPTIRNVLFEGTGPKFSVNTQSGTANIAIEGNIKGIADITYQGGNTNIIFADSQANSLGGGSDSDLSNYSSGDVILNGAIYKDGVLIRLRADMANKILASYRKYFPMNATTFTIDKITNQTNGVYVANIEGVLAGEIDSLESSSLSPKIEGGGGSKTYDAVLKNQAVFVGKLNIINDTSISLSQGSKLILNSNSRIYKIAPQGNLILDEQNLEVPTLLQNNAVIDLVTAKTNSLGYSTLSISNVEGLENALFRVSYNPDANASDEQNKKADHIVIENVQYEKSSTQTLISAQADEANRAPLINFLQIYINTGEVLKTGEDLTSKNILVASIKNDPTTNQPKMRFKTYSSVLQGYDIISSSLIERVESSSQARVGNKVDMAIIEQGGATILSSTPSNLETIHTNTDTDKTTNEVIKENASEVTEATSGTTLKAVKEVTEVTSSNSNEVSKQSSDEVTTRNALSASFKDGEATWTNYYIASTTYHIQASALQTAKSSLISNYSIFIDNINNLNKRLGELRNNPYAQGTWARIFNSMSNIKRGDEVQISAINIQGGYDYSLFHSSAQSYIGGALTYGRDSLSSSNLEAKANIFEVGVYYSYLNNNGLYSDSILKYSFISNNISMKDTINKDIPLNSSTISLGEEIGYRFNFNLKDLSTIKHAIYLEPQAEAVFGYLTKGTFEQKNIEGALLQSSTDSILAFRTRVGGVMGYSLKTLKNQTDLRIGLSYVGDFGSTKMNFKTQKSNESLELDSNHMAVVSLGVNSILNQNWRVYLDIDSGFAGKYYNQTYLVSLGGRYAFGKTRLVKQADVSKQANHWKKLPQGYYLEVHSILESQELTQEQEDLLKKYPYAIEYVDKDIKEAQGKSKGNSIKKVGYKNYLLGVFKTKDGVMKNQKIANEIATILNNKPSKALLREVK